MTSILLTKTTLIIIMGVFHLEVPAVKHLQPWQQHPRIHGECRYLATSTSNTSRRNRHAQKNARKVCIIIIIIIKIFIFHFLIFFIIIIVIVNIMFQFLHMMGSMTSSKVLFLNLIKTSCITSRSYNFLYTNALQSTTKWRVNLFAVI